MSKPVSVCNKHIHVRICSQMINDNTSVSPLQSPNRHRPAQQLLCACQIICAGGSFTLGTERPGCICLLWHRSSQRLLEHTWLWPAPVLHTECNHCLQPLSTCKPVTDSMTFAARQSGAETLKRVFFAQLCFRIVRAHQAGKSGKTVHFFRLIFGLLRVRDPSKWEVWVEMMVETHWNLFLSNSREQTSREVVEDGYEFFANKGVEAWQQSGLTAVGKSWKLFAVCQSLLHCQAIQYSSWKTQVTIFSAPNYCGEFDNAAAVPWLPLSVSLNRNGKRFILNCIPNSTFFLLARCHELWSTERHLFTGGSPHWCRLGMRLLCTALSKAAGPPAVQLSPSSYCRVEQATRKPKQEVSLAIFHLRLRS